MSSLTSTLSSPWCHEWSSSAADTCDNGLCIKRLLEFDSCANDLNSHGSASPVPQIYYPWTSLSPTSHLLYSLPLTHSLLGSQPFFLQYCYIRSLMVNWNEFFLWKVLKRAGEYSRDWRSHWNETSIGGCWYWFLFFYFQSIMFNKVENIIVKRWTICWL